MASPPTPSPIEKTSAASDAEIHYTSLLAYFKHLVWLTGIFGAAAGLLFYSNLRDVRQDAKDQAARVATQEAQQRVAAAFEEKNISNQIQEVAKQKVEAVTEKMIEQKVDTVADRVIEQRLSSKLRPVEERILLIGRISESEAQMHIGLRVGLVELNRIISTTRDPQALQFAKSTLTSLGEQYDAFWLNTIKTSGLRPIEFMTSRAFLTPGKPVAANVSGAVTLINNSQDLNDVGVAFIAFRDMTGEHIRTFDLAGVKAWCEKHKPQCQ